MDWSRKQFELISEMFFFIVKTLQLGSFYGPAYNNVSCVLSILLLII